MHFSSSRLHPPLLRTDEDRELVRGKIEALVSRRPKSDGRVAMGSRITIPLTTVAKSGNFDSYIDVQFPVPDGCPVKARLLVDSGNDCLVVPCSHALINSGAYKFWGSYTEPFGCPAYLLQGTLQIPTLDGSIYEIGDCVFYACYADNPSGGGRTANFGAGRVIPWQTMEFGPPPQTQLTIASPFAYKEAYSFVEFIFAPAAMLLPGADGGPVVTDGSYLVLNSYMPSGYRMMEIIPNVIWMAVVPTSLTINGTLTGWPGSDSSPLAQVDTGGGPVLVSDPNGHVNLNPWPDRVACPTWASDGCYPDRNCTCAPLQLGFAGYGNVGTYSYSIDASALPAPAQGLTSMVYKPDPGTDVMNIGGLSMLFNRLLVEYAGSRIGLLPQTPSWPPTVEMTASINQPIAVPRSGVLLGYDNFSPGIVTTTMSVSWTALPAGATIRIKHDGSAGAQIVSWTGPDSSTDASGSLQATFMINLNAGAAAPVYIYVFGYEYLPLNIQLTASTT